MSYFERSIEQLELPLPQNPEKNPWSDPRREEMLRELLPKHSAAQVAVSINRATGSDLSRNAVIGKAARIGLVGHVAHPNKRGGANKALGRPMKPRKPPTQLWGKSNASVTAPMEIQAIQIEEPKAGPLEMSPKGIMELENNHCRWICGDPLDPAHFYCGADGADLIEGRPYCPSHSRMAYQPARKPLNAGMAGPAG